MPFHSIVVKLFFPCNAHPCSICFAIPADGVSHQKDVRAKEAATSSSLPGTARNESLTNQISYPKLELFFCLVIQATRYTVKLIYVKLF
jgi:hypothetical protein